MLRNIASCVDCWLVGGERVVFVGVGLMYLLFSTHLIYSVCMKSGCPDIVIKYSPEIDVSVVRSTLAYGKWYIEHGYKPQLPGGVDINEVKEGNEKDLCSRAENEYNEGLYKETAAAITEQWKKYTERHIKS